MAMEYLIMGLKAAKKFISLGPPIFLNELSVSCASNFGRNLSTSLG